MYTQPPIVPPKRTLFRTLTSEGFLTVFAVLWLIIVILAM
jgi:hypothetical protein